MQRRTYLAAVAGGAGTLAGCAGIGSDPSGGEPDGFAVETVAEGFADPWGIAFLADDRMLVTERPGRLALVDRADGEVERLDGLPDVYAAGQGGLLDVTVGPGDDRVYLTYSATNGEGRSATHLGAGQLDAEGGALAGFEQLHAATPYVDSDAHFGSRVVVADDHLYVTAGDRQFKEFGPDHVAQDRSNELGTVLRLNPDGSVPADNPLVDEAGARDTIFSYGHRNPQGLTRHPETDELWASEHGEGDGDEINVLEAENNYGWPVASEACNYGTDVPVGVSHSERNDVTGPAYVWECGTGGFPPAGMTFYDGDAFPEWQGDLFVGNLVAKYLGHLSVDGRDLTEEAPLLADRGWRVRDVAVAPESGHLHVAVDGSDAPLVRLVPESATHR